MLPTVSAVAIEALLEVEAAVGLVVGAPLVVLLSGDRSTAVAVVGYVGVAAWAMALAVLVWSDVGRVVHRRHTQRHPVVSRDRRHPADRQGARG